MLSEKLMANVRFPNWSKAGIKSFSEEQENVLTYILKYEKELNFVRLNKVIQGVPSSEDERRKLQEISAAELQHFVITFVLGLRVSSLDTSAVARLDLFAWGGGGGAVRSAEGTSC